MDKIIFPTTHLRKPTYSARKRAAAQRKHMLKMNKYLDIMYKNDWDDLLRWIYNPET